MKITITDTEQIFTIADKLAEKEIELLKDELNKTYKLWVDAASIRIVDKLSIDAIDFSKEDATNLRLVMKKEVLPSHSRDLFKGLNGIVDFK